MEDRACKDKEITRQSKNALVEHRERRLRAAAARIVPDESARERIIEGARAGRRSRRRLKSEVPAAVFAACLLLSLLWFARAGFIGEDVVVYAATEEHGWQKLQEGERILLKKEPFQTLAEGEEEFSAGGESNYYPYICTFQVEMSENYRYNCQMVMLRDDRISENGDTIAWRVAPERPEDAGRTMQGAFRLWIVDENLHQVAALDLELTKEDGMCYAELKRVWESEAYLKQRQKK